MTSTPRPCLAARAAMGALSMLVVIEGVKTAVSPRPQAMLALCIVVLGVLGVINQLSMAQRPLSSLVGRFSRVFRSVEEVRFLLAGHLSLAQCTYMMATNASGGIYMTWLTFVAACVNLAVWLLLVLQADNILGIAGKRLRSVANNKLSFLRSLTRAKALLIGVVVTVLTLWIVVVLLPWDDVAKHDSRWNSIRQTLTRDGADAAQRAETYWKTQKPLILESLRNNFTLHPYFGRTEVWKGARWDEMINQRITAMGQQMEQSGKKGFMIEKDKCAMFEFFVRHDIPVAKIGWISHSFAETEEKLREIQQNQGSYKFPLFLKGCHLTQGSDSGMMALKSSHLSAGKFDSELIPWLKKKWAQKPNDDGRAWAVTMNKLLHTLQPGMALQHPFQGMRVSPYNTPLEVKVEVLWGRAYLGLFADYHDVIALRDGSLEFTCRDSACSEWWTHGNVPDKRLQWVQENGHMEGVWKLAELTAQRIGIDEARIDIFIDPAKPESPVVNEISLSSGHEYFYHTDFLAEAWAAPHRALAKGKRVEGWPVPEVRKTEVEVHLQPKPQSGKKY
mmetsp:Transcript_2263/g.3607  ORF Transcript_2263/g.3607 Transcript_2263/m.3607 type:complete len:561 (-) Transcript_2263:287-1969(-)